MNINLAKTLGRSVGLVIVTIVALAVMLSTTTNYSPSFLQKSEPPPTKLASSIEAAAPVVVRQLRSEPVEITDSYSGMIHPFERYSLSFEIAGRIDRLGTNDDGRSVDEGDTVRKGQVLAVLDQRILKATIQESTAVLEQAQQELQRARQLRDSRSGVITETDFQRRVTELAVAKAKLEMAQKNLEDATLKSPCDGVLSKRLVNAGESINMHQPGFEIVQVDRVLLMVGVPESRIREIDKRRRQIQQWQKVSESTNIGSAPVSLAPEHRFRVHVQLMGTNRFGQPWPPLQGEVYRVSETADDKTGLFEVEVLLANPDRELKPGLIALGKIVIDEVMGYRIPLTSVLFDEGKPYVYSLEQQQSDLDFLFWRLGSPAEYRARSCWLTKYVEQDGELVVPELPQQCSTVVVRGQHRLVDGRKVRIVRIERPEAENMTARPEPAPMNAPVN